MDNNNYRKPDIKKRTGFISIAGWFQTNDYRDTKFEIVRSFKIKNKIFKNYKIRFSYDELLQLLPLITNTLNENYEKLGSDEILIPDSDNKIFYQ